MGAPHAAQSLYVSLLLLVAGAAASVTQVNGTCPTNAPNICGPVNCCDSTQTCLAEAKGTGKSCMPRWYLPVVICLVIPGAILIMTLIANKSQQGRAAEQPEGEATPPADNLPPAAPEEEHESAHHKAHHKAHTAVSVPQ